MNEDIKMSDVAPANTSSLILDSINRNKNGDYYIIFRVPNVARGMHGKFKGHVDELLIIGVPQAKIDDFLKSHDGRVSK